MKASDLLVKCLEAEGTEYIFGLPGEENADFMMSLEKSEKIEFVLTRHEQGAAFMANAYGRLTGKAGVCLSTLGPGASNLLTGVADANMDRAPLVAITGQAERTRMHKESHQATDIVRMFRPVTKWNSPIIHPDNIPEVVRKAFKIAQSEKPGACHIELPEDVAALDTDNVPIFPKKLRRPVPDEKILNRAFDTIVKARKPVIIAGNGVIRRKAEEQLRKFARRTGIGVINTFMAKGVVSKDSPESLFTIGMQSRDLVNCAIEASDVVIAVGYDMVEYHPRLWNPEKKHKIVHIDFQPAEIDDFYRTEVEVVGDIAHTLWMLNERLQDTRDLPVFSTEMNKTLREQMLADFSEHKDDETEDFIRPQKAIWDAREVLGKKDILLSDVGAHKVWIARYYSCYEPNTCLIPNGYASMGFALPGAILADLIYPDRKVMAICGDGGVLMNIQEMETATRVGSDIVVFVWEDHSYGLMRWKQSGVGRHSNVNFGNPDWISLARAFGWNGFRCDRSVDLKRTLEHAFDTDGPSLSWSWCR
ncbi:MAG: acetolactate synthase large subunit [Planctomycetota bacterium]|nr:acetolactate synthase large subunit [Planctomycetota bacterium]